MQTLVTSDCDPFFGGGSVQNYSVDTTSATIDLSSATDPSGKVTVMIKLRDTNSNPATNGVYPRMTITDMTLNDLGGQPERVWDFRTTNGGAYTEDDPSTCQYNCGTLNGVPPQHSYKIHDTVLTEDGSYVLYRNTSLGKEYVAFSSDSGVTWAITPIDESGDVSNERGNIFADNDGNIGVIYNINEQGGETNIVFRSSTNNGTTWSEPIRIDDADDNEEFMSNAGNDDQNIFVTATEDAGSEGQFAYVSNDFGATWSDLIILQEGIGLSGDIEQHERGHVAVHGMNMYATWIAYDNSEARYIVYFTKSIDDGATFSTAIEVSQTAIDNTKTEIFLNEDGGKIFIDWINANSEPTQARSINGGTTFLSEEVVEDLTFCSDEFNVSVHNEDAFWMCYDNSFGTDTFNSIISTDFGATYSNPAPIVFAEGFDFGWGSSNDFPYLEYTGDNIYFMGTDDGGIDVNEPTYLAYSQDNGASWNSEFVATLNGTSSFQQDYSEGEGTGMFSAFEDDFYWFIADVVGELTVLYSEIINTATIPPDTTPPVIGTFFGEPVALIEDTIFDDLDHVFCLDDIDGDISITMDIDGTVNTANRGQYFVTYTCTDTLLNETETEIQFIVNKKSGGSGGGGTTPQGTSGGISSTITVEDIILEQIPRLEDIPTLSTVTTVEELDRVEEIQETVEGVRLSISDLFSNLFSERLDVDTGERVDFAEIINDRVQQVRDTSLGETSDVIQERASPVLDFFRDLFSGFFN